MSTERLLDPRRACGSCSISAARISRSSAATIAAIRTRRGIGSAPKRRCTPASFTNSPAPMATCSSTGCRIPTVRTSRRSASRRATRCIADPDVFASSPDPVDIESGELGALNSMLSMGGAQHRRYRTLVQPSFVPAKAQWWIRQLDRGDGAPPHRRLHRPTVAPSSTSTSARRSPCSRSPGASACRSSGRSTSGPRCSSARPTSSR